MHNKFSKLSYIVFCKSEFYSDYYIIYLYILV